MLIQLLFYSTYKTNTKTMENFKWFEKWYSKHVIEHYNKKVSITIKNDTKDHSWKLNVDFSNSDYKHLDAMNESKKVSDYNHYEINAKGKKFEAVGDFTKLNFILGKFRTYIGETDFHLHDNDYFLNPDIQSFIFENEKDANIFLHYTSEKNIVDEILKKGFEFLVFDKTTVSMINDTISINYNHMLRKPFGDFALVICIGKDVSNKYSKLINNSQKNNIKVEEVLAEKPPYQIDFNENVYTLHHKFIKGYLNYTTGEIVKNPDFEMNFDSPEFKTFI